MKKKVAVIGSGFAGLSAAALLAKDGFEVTVFEKNEQPGGRARIWKQDGFTFDMGPSWYWMPDVFENYFSLFGKKVSDYYRLDRLDPAYRIWFGTNDRMDIPAGLQELYQLFEQQEPGSSGALRKYLERAAYKYRKGMGKYVFMPSDSIKEFLKPGLLLESFRTDILQSISAHIRQHFKNPKLISLLEFPALFLGATPQNTPALYSLMNYADLVLGTWYPAGGMNRIVQAMVSLGEEAGVIFRAGKEVARIRVVNGIASGVETADGVFHAADFVVANADYRHTDQCLLEPPWRMYTDKYWNSRVLSPSALLFYVGLDRKVKNILHHNLFFDESFVRHADEIYTDARWPEKPLFYVSCPSKTDASVAPEGYENLFFLIPVAPGLSDTAETREHYLNLLMERFGRVTGEWIHSSVILKRSYSLNDFSADYHSFKGNAYGLANTLSQTAFLKPKMRSSRVKNLLYTGQLTVPGPGVPPAIISGQIAAKEVSGYFGSVKS